MKLLASLVAVGAVSLTASVALAAEYVCAVRHEPNTSGLGSGGSLYVTTYTGANCTGTFVDSWLICTTGATYAQCATSYFQYTPDQLMTHFRILTDYATTSR